MKTFLAELLGLMEKRSLMGTYHSDEVEICKWNANRQEWILSYQGKDRIAITVNAQDRTLRTSDGLTVRLGREGDPNDKNHWPRQAPLFAYLATSQAGELMSVHGMEIPGGRWIMQLIVDESISITYRIVEKYNKQ